MPQRNHSKSNILPAASNQATLFLHAQLACIQQQLKEVATTKTTKTVVATTTQKIQQQ